jgi:hypothetical protein
VELAGEVLTVTSRERGPATQHQHHQQQYSTRLQSMS